METNLINNCIASCKQCAIECKSNALQITGISDLEKCAQLSFRCAAECEFLATICPDNFAEDSVYREKCAIACEECATECEKYEHPICRRVAESCRRFQLTPLFQTRVYGHLYENSSKIEAVRC
jgi:hypothetical protein